MPSASQNADSSIDDSSTSKGKEIGNGGEKYIRKSRQNKHSPSKIRKRSELRTRSSSSSSSLHEQQPKAKTNATSAAKRAKKPRSYLSIDNNYGNSTMLYYFRDCMYCNLNLNSRSANCKNS